MQGPWNAMLRFSARSAAEFRRMQGYPDSSSKDTLKGWPAKVGKDGPKGYPCQVAPSLLSWLT
eukprot:535106-Pyramimonas_sp.AAC.1